MRYNYFDFIDEMVSSSSNFRGHMTQASPESLFEDGLFMACDDINTTTLSFYPKKREAIIKQISEWRHRYGHNLIILEIPDELIAESKRDQALVAFTLENNNFGDQGGGYMFKVPPKYIRGCIDVSTGEFIENPNFKFSKNNPDREREIEKAKKELSIGYIYRSDGQSYLFNPEKGIGVSSSESSKKDKSDLDTMFDNDRDNARSSFKIPIVEKYMELKKDYSKSVQIFISKREDGTFSCLLTTFDKVSGTKDIVMEENYEFEGDFSHIVLPSLYSQVCDGFPAIIHDKESSNNYMSRMQGIDRDDVLAIGGLSKEEFERVKYIQRYVDEQTFGKIDDDNQYGTKGYF